MRRLNIRASHKDWLACNELGASSRSSRATWVPSESVSRSRGAKQSSRGRIASHEAVAEPVLTAAGCIGSRGPDAEQKMAIASPADARGSVASCSCSRGRVGVVAAAAGVVGDARASVAAIRADNEGRTAIAACTTTWGSVRVRSATEAACRRA